MKTFSLAQTIKLLYYPCIIDDKFDIYVRFTRYFKYVLFYFDIITVLHNGPVRIGDKQNVAVTELEFL